MAFFPELKRLGCSSHEFDGVIFDFDGTLADSMDVWTDIDWLFCEKYNLGVPDDFRESIVGLGFEGTAEYFINNLGVTMTVQECCDEFNRLALDRYKTEVFLRPGAKEFLDLLDSRGVPFCIASSLNRELLDVALEANGVQGRFASICLCDDYQTHKSESKIYLVAAESMGVDPAKCMVFEDIVPAIASAQAAGMFVIGIIDEGNGAQDTPAVQRNADLGIVSFQELLP